MRACMTHVAFICDDVTLQLEMPQVIIANEHTFLVRDFERYFQEAPNNVYLIRHKSAWNNSVVMKQIIDLVAAIVAPYLGVMTPILFFDAHRCHLGDAIFRACRRGGIFPILIPARLTWLLQPCDTHAFQIYKRILREEYDNVRMRMPGGQVPTQDFLKALYTTVRRVLQGHSWRGSFDENGFSPAQTHVSNCVRGALEWTTLPTMAKTQPSISDLKALFPKNSSVPWDPIFRVPLPRALPLPPPPRSHAFDLVRDSGPPMTRARAKALAIASSAAEGSRASAPKAVAFPLPWRPPTPVPRPSAPTRRLLPWALPPPTASRTSSTATSRPSRS